MLASPVSHWGKLHVVRLGVELDRFRPTDGREARAAFHLASVGQLQPAKGYYLLLDAVATLAGDGHDVRLTLAGDGPDRAALEDHARRTGVGSRVRFLGEVNQEQVRALFADVDVFVLPSFAEGIPVVLMEAMASGLPCVATRISGIPELIVEGESGLLVTPSEVGELAAAIARLLTDPALRARLHTGARARIRAMYDLPQNVELLVRLFERHLAEHT
jgi:glycosyltransferase involved in cell wall biosynthesis